MSKKTGNLAEYQKYKDQLAGLEIAGNGQSKSANQIRQMLIQLWNSLSPEQQKEMAVKYLPKD